MADYIIATDATIDLYKKTIHEIDVHVIPMTYIVDGQERIYDPENEDFNFTGFYDELEKARNVSTSQITPAMYYSFFEKLLKISKKIVYICFSSGLSGTYGSSVIAVNDIKEDYPDADIRVIDSLCASVGEGLLVMHACRKRSEGMSFEKLVQFVEKNKRDVCHWFVVGNLEQLRKGGRIGSVEARLGSLLSIHPILSTDSEGRLCVVSKVRGMKKAVYELFGKLKSKGRNLIDQTIILGYARERGCAELLAKMINEEKLVKECKIMEIGPVIGSHTGAPMCAVTFIGDNRSN